MAPMTKPIGLAFNAVLNAWVAMVAPLVATADAVVAPVNKLVTVVVAPVQNARNFCAATDNCS